MKATVLLVGDDPIARGVIRDSLDGYGLAVVEAGSCRAAERRFAADRPEVAVLDYRLPDGDALSLLEALRRADPDLPVVILTG